MVNEALLWKPWVMKNVAAGYILGLKIRKRSIESRLRKSLVNILKSSEVFRIVMLKQCTHKNFTFYVFFTNYSTRQLFNQAMLTFYLSLNGLLWYLLLPHALYTSNLASSNSKNLWGKILTCMHGVKLRIYNNYI